MEAFRYEGDAKGWAALGLGPWMTGALMFIIYGDPTAPNAPLTLTVRTAEGHRPPLPLADVSPPFIPEVDITYAKFDEYTGGFNHADMGKPSHVAVADFIVRGYDRWGAVKVSNTSTNQPFIWSSNFKQDFEGDFSESRHIDMHMFGLGFGFLFIDLQNAQVPTAFYGEIRDTEPSYGINEIGDPDPPTDEELTDGQAAIARLTGQSSPDSSPTDDPKPTLAPEQKDPPTSATAQPAAAAGAGTNPESGHVHAPPNSLRNFMWHLHGLLMILAFLLLYPLGVYLLRSPRPTAFNFHWTLQALGTTTVFIGALVGYFNSHGISIWHQYLGFAILALLAVQVLLGWRHHVGYVATKTKGWFSPAHVWLGRGVGVAGCVNIFSGLNLRGYGWFTILLVVLVMVLEALGLVWYIRGVRVRNARIDAGAGGGARGKGIVDPADAAAEEEYFQLAGDDDDGEFSDSDAGETEAEGAAARTRAQERREQNQRLAQLDKV